VPFEFINVDLEITATEPLDELRDVLTARGDRFFEMYCGPGQGDEFLASFEIHPDDEITESAGDEPAVRSLNACEKMMAFCAELESLPERARSMFDNAKGRVFDVGYLSDDHCKPLADKFPCGLLAKLAALNIDLALTVYPRTIVHVTQTEPGTARHSQ
jgi:hypothetical protein